MNKNPSKQKKSFKHFGFESIYLGNSQYLSPGFITIDSEGFIQSLSNKTPRTEQKIRNFKGILLPGFVNAHSHAFQRSMAGLCEYTTKKELGNDDFWTWRSKMYELAIKQNPELIFKSYTKIYSEMLRHGFTRVVEFHYLHGMNKDSSKKHLSFEMSHAVSEAAQEAGIELTLIPVFYERGGVDKQPNKYQQKFCFESLDQYSTLHKKIQKLYQKDFPNFILGSGVHSLRAVNSNHVKEILGSKFFTGPKHIHVAEQQAEVEEILKHYGKRPVEWLAQNNCLNSDTHLVHATHLLPRELSTILQAKSTVVLCPSTEANLGDGLFPIEDFQKQSGKWSIGTDSHITLNFFEELRWLDYGCRLRLQKRLSLASSKYLRPAEYLLDTAISNGRSAAGIAPSKNLFNLGDMLSGVLCHLSSEVFQTARPEDKSSIIVYTGDSSAITHVFNGVKLHSYI